ncbi:hypothetical protein PA598K_04397, partial [Paenibacillus sp. 598K]|uniref:endo-1,4-beta-xylanase n=1 Tax=Paenibacillus sp. 598K TaxID=1117987 RepID=UPI000FF9F9B8
TLQGNNLELLKQHHNVFTAENAMKPDAMYNASREYTPDAAVSLVDKALAEGMKVHGHVLIWHSQSPGWLPTTDPAGLDLETEGLSERDAALVRMKAHITRVVETFGDKVISWDVVNEAIRDNPSNPDDWKNALRMGEAAWNQAIGPDYIEMAFRYAKEALEKNGWDDVKLYYNDYNEDTRSKAIAIASMVKELNDKYAKEHPGKLLIDGIGMQAHYNSGTRIANVQWSLETFIDLGVEVSVSELDIQSGDSRVQTDAQKIAQGNQYAQLFELYKKHADNIARVTFWGINDTASWRVETSPLIFDGRMQAKPAYYAVADPAAFLEEHGQTGGEVEVRKSTAFFGTPTIDGTVDAAWEKAPALPISRYQTAHNGAKGTARVLWDSNNLYVLVQVTNNQTLDKSSAAAHEQDSVEVFVDQKNLKSAVYEAGVGQYRVNFDNETSFNPDGIGENVTSVTKVEGTNYTVELKIPLTEIDPKAEQEIGFDVQINDGESGARRSVATWNDTSGQGYNDPSVFGVLTLKSDAPPPTNNNGNWYLPPVTQPETSESTDGPTVTVDAEGRATATVSAENVAKAVSEMKQGTLKLKIATGDEVRQVTVTLPAAQLLAAKKAGAERLDISSGLASVQLPVSLFEGIADDATIELTIKAVDRAALPAGVRAQIGSHQVYDFTLKVAGELLSDFGSHPVKVSLPYALQSGEQPEQVVVYYVADNGQLEVIKPGRYNAETGQAEFNAKHFSQYTAFANLLHFADTQSIAWARESVGALAARGIINGFNAQQFGPHQQVTRAQFIQMLVNTMDLQQADAVSTYSDVKPDAWYAGAVASAQQLGIVTGLPDGSFGVHAPITRAEMATMTYRAIQATGVALPEGATSIAFRDAQSIPVYARDAVAALQQAELISGIGNQTFNPAGTATRAQAAVLLYNLLKSL